MLTWGSVGMVFVVELGGFEGEGMVNMIFSTLARARATCARV